MAADELDLGALARAVWRRKRLIAVLTVGAAAIAYFAASTITPRYRSEARVLIESRENIFLRPEAQKSVEQAAAVDLEAVTSQVQLILSRDLALEVIGKLKLSERPEFDPALADVSPLKTLLMQFGVIKDPLKQPAEERVLKSYFDRLVAYPVDKSRVIAIEFDSEDPELAAQVTNAIAESYLVFQQAAKQEQSRVAGQWLAGEIETLRGRVADAESKVEQYRADTNLFIGTNNTTLSNQQLGEINAQLSVAQARKADAEVKARVIRDALRSGSPIDFADIINSELIRRLSEQRVTLQGQLAEQSSTLLDQHPRIKELRAQIADLDRQLRAEADRLARSFENEAQISAARVSSLGATLDQLKRSAARTNEQDVQLRALEREAKAQRDLLESYLAKYREASARDNLGAASPEARIISRALVSSTPAYPKVLATVLIASLGTFILCLGFIISGALLTSMPDPTVSVQPARRYEPVAAPTGISASRMNLAASGRRATTTDVPEDPIDVLAREVNAAGPQAHRIAVFETRLRIGATDTALALARRLAKLGAVALVDLSFSGGLSAIVSDPATPGISELDAGIASFGDLITRDRYSPVHVILAGQTPSASTVVLRSPRLSVAIEALARSYDHVVIDGGLLSEATLDLFARLALLAVLVAEGVADPAVASARDSAVAAGFANVNVLAKGPRGEQVGAASAAAA
jgi:uncharacterized protein involved in exopolysaccharide biosynthesis